MSKQKQWGMKATVAAACLAAGVANAQSARTNPLPALDITRFDLNPGAEESLITATGRLSKVGELRISLLGAYLSQPSVTRLGTDAGNVRLGDRVEGHALLSYSFHERLQLHAQLPVVLHQNEGTTLSSKGFAPVSPNGIGSPLIGLRVGVLQQDDEMPVSLALGVAGGLPVGASATLTREPQARFVPSLSLGRSFGDFAIGGQVYARFRSQENFQFRGLSPDVTDTATHELGASLSLSSEITEGVRTELGVITDFALKNGGATVQPFLGARYRIDPGLELFAGGGPAFGSLVGTPEFRVLGGIAFGGGGAPPAAAPVAATPVVVAVAVDRDRDGDGILNAQDPCPEEAEDIDGFEDEDGCAEDDNDKDGVPDTKDVCPNEAGPAERGGCPIGDQDKDGVPDEVDLCPTEPGDRAEAGCPVKDTDKDGISDREDACVNEAGLKEHRGCPAPDQDKDGVADSEDNCVGEPGPKTNRGCPEKQKQLVVIQKEQLQILDKIYFMPGKAQILKNSRVLLDQVAKILKEHPEIAKIRIEGHTDDVGRDEMNKKLSQARAQAVVTYLIKKGINKSRLEAVGYGEEKPIADNTTEQGRETNRRVDFVIFGQQ